MAHSHNCAVCGQAVALCGDEACQGNGPYYCTVHHPDPAVRRVDPPTVRMHVKVVPDAPDEAAT